MKLPARATRLWIGAGLVFAATFAFRFLSVDGITNDHFVHVARAFNVLAGDWPVRDFEDPGLPLMSLASAAAMRMFGPSLLTEVTLCVVMLAAAAACTFRAAAMASGSIGIAGVVTLVEIAAVPRLYNYPKLLVYAAAVLLIFQYASRPRASLAAGMGLLTAVGFLFRHDHGLYLAPAFLLLIMTRAERQGTGARHALPFATAAIVALVPYLIYVQNVAGLDRYLRAGMRFSAAEALRTRLNFGELTLADFAVLIPLVSLPIICGLLIAARLVTRRATLPEMAPAASLTALVTFVEAGFLREELNVRAADVFAPVSVLVAWLAGQAVASWRGDEAEGGQRFVLPAAAASVAAAVAFVAVSVGRPALELDRTRLLESGAAVRLRATHVYRTLQTWPWSQVAPGQSLEPLARYVDACSNPRDRLFVGWFAPELSFVARRPFAAGHPAFMPGYYTDVEDRVLMVDRLMRQSVPLVLVRSKDRREFDLSWPEISQRIATRYVQIGHFGPEADGVQVYADRLRTPTATYAPLGWPCFSERPSPQRASPQG